MKCIEDEIPFDVPEGWEWCRLKHICMMAAGKAKPTEQIKQEPFDGCYPCFGGNGIRGYVDEYNQDGIYSIIGRQGALCGNINIASGKFYATEHAVVTTIFSGIDFKWSNYILEALNLNNYATGAAQPGLSVSNVLNVLVPLAPSHEQVFIGAKISIFIKIIEAIEQEKKELQRIITRAKSKILDLAIRGKLVPQNPNDEPASVLLERIRAEKAELIKQGKIKRDKKESIIFRGDDNSYYQNNGDETIDISNELAFNIPDSWCWGELKDIVIINPRNKLDDDMDVAFVSMPLIEDGYSGNHTFEIRKWKDIKNGFTHFMEGDIGVAKITPCFENKKSVVFKNLCNGYGAGTTELHILRPYKNTVLPEYLLAYVKTDQFIENGRQRFSGAVGQQRIGKEYIETIYFPIPPLQEQHRIVKQVNDLFSYLNIMTNALS